MRLPFSWWKVQHFITFSHLLMFIEIYMRISSFVSNLWENREVFSKNEDEPTVKSTTTRTWGQWRILGWGRKGQIFFVFMQFLGKILVKIPGWHPHLCGWCPRLWEILDPPLADTIHFAYHCHWILFRTLWSHCHDNRMIWRHHTSDFYENSHFCSMNLNWSHLLLK